MSTVATQYVFLARDPGSSYKQLAVKGRGIHARTLYGRFMSDADPMTPEEIAADYDLPLEAVREAIAYCQSNPPEIAEDFRREEALAEAQGMNEPGYKYHPTPKPISPQEIARINRS